MFLTLPAPVGAYRTVKAATYFDDPGARTLRTELYSQRYAQKTRPIVGNLQSFPMSCELFTYHCPMNSRDRRLTIAERLKVNREASIAELAFAFGTSEMTIRRDLELLEVEGLARRIRGGAISTQGRSYEPPILQRGARCV